MKYALPTSTLALALLASASAEPMVAAAYADTTVSVQQDGARKIIGSGVRASEVRSVAPFTQISASDASNLVITVGEAFSVKVTADDNVLATISTATKGDTLHIETQGSYSVKQAPVVTITLPHLEGIEMRGSGDARIDGVNGGAVTLRGGGSGDFVVSGRADSIVLRINGSGDADLRALNALDIDAAINGSGSAMIRASRSIRAAVFGSGDIRYSGTDNVEQQVYGSGRIFRQPG